MWKRKTNEEETSTGPTNPGSIQSKQHFMNTHFQKNIQYLYIQQYFVLVTEWCVLTLYHKIIFDPQIKKLSQLREAFGSKKG